MHIDFAGPFIDRMFLLLVDTRSEWGEVIDMAKSTTATSTVAALRHHFAAYGLTEHNGPQFDSEECTMFLQANGDKHG